jgi:hypothetical protein
LYVNKTCCKRLSPNSTPPIPLSSSSVASIPRPSPDLPHRPQGGKSRGDLAAFPVPPSLPSSLPLYRSLSLPPSLSLSLVLLRTPGLSFCGTPEEGKTWRRQLADCRLPLSLPPSFPLTLAFVCYLASLPFFPPRLIVHACVRACKRASERASEHSAVRPSVRLSVTQAFGHSPGFFSFFNQCFLLKNWRILVPQATKKIVTCECYKGFFFLNNFFIIYF